MNASTTGERNMEIQSEEHPTPVSIVSGTDRGFMPKFALGDRVRKRSGSSWQGRVVGFYTTALTPNGYAVESEREPGSVQIYPEAALENADV
jgi:hypothetical protein